MSLLTRKQQWRRVKTRRPHQIPQEIDASTANEVLDILGLGERKVGRANTWDSIFWRKNAITADKRSNSWHNSTAFGRGGSDDDSGERGGRSNSSAAVLQASRQVRFDKCVHVLLVPSRKDYDEVTANNIWYSCEEINSFRRFAFQFWKLHGKLSVFAEEELQDPPTPAPLDATRQTADVTTLLASPAARTQPVAGGRGGSAGAAGAGGSVELDTSALHLLLRDDDMASASRSLCAVKETDVIEEGEGEGEGACGPEVLAGRNCQALEVKPETVAQCASAPVLAGCRAGVPCKASGGARRSPLMSADKRAPAPICDSDQGKDESLLESRSHAGSLSSEDSELSTTSCASSI